jgi:hypothetical protein
MTEADWRLFATLVRFDCVYVGHFKCNFSATRRLSQFVAYARDLFQWPAVRHTVDFEHIKRHYYRSQTTINPSGIVSIGPVVDFARPQGERYNFLRIDRGSRPRIAADRTGKTSRHVLVRRALGSVLTDTRSADAVSQRPNEAQ